MWIKAKRTLVGDYGLLEGGKKADIEDRIAEQLIKKGYAEATEPDEGEKPQRRGRRGN